MKPKPLSVSFLIVPSDTSQLLAFARKHLKRDLRAVLAAQEVNNDPTEGRKVDRADQAEMIA